MAEDNKQIAIKNKIIYDSIYQYFICLMAYDILSNSEASLTESHFIKIKKMIQLTKFKKWSEIVCSRFFACFK